MISFENTGIRLLDIEELEYVSGGEEAPMEEEVVVTAERPRMYQMQAINDSGSSIQFGGSGISISCCELPVPIIEIKADIFKLEISYEDLFRGARQNPYIMGDLPE
jgi:hypothetical protein